MALFGKLMGVPVAGEDNPVKIPIHTFSAALGLWESGLVARAQVVSGLGLDPDDEVDLDWLKGKYDASADKVNFVAEVEMLLVLGEAGLFGLDQEATFVAAINALS